MDPGVAWFFGLLSMLTVFIVLYRMGEGLQKSLLFALIWGKIYAGVMWVLGVDKPVLTIYRYVPGYGYYPIHTLTANMIIFILFLTTALTTWFWEDIRRELHNVI